MSEATINELVARNVRRYRQERGLSLGELARRSGLSKQNLSRIEQGAGNPTVETLTLLGKALDVPARRLLTEWGTPIYVQRADDAVWDDIEGGTERLLDETYGSGYVRNMVVTLVKGVGAEGKTIDAYSAGTLNHVYVISGRMQTGPINDLVELGPGDFARYPADLPHAHRALTDKVVAQMVTTLPQLQQFASVRTRQQ